MFYYYIVDSLKQLKENWHRLGPCEAVGTVHPNVSGHVPGVQHEEVLVKMVFSDHGTMDWWESLPFVHPLPHALEDDELSDEHMGKLERFHPYRMKPGTKAWHHPGTGQVLDKKPHTRHMMNKHVGKHYPSFRFRLFV